MLMGMLHQGITAGAGAGAGADADGGAGAGALVGVGVAGNGDGMPGFGTVTDGTGGTDGG